MRVYVNARASDSDSANRGSNPRPPAIPASAAGVPVSLSDREARLGRVVLLTTHASPTPRQILLMGALAARGGRPLSIGWDRSRSGGNIRVREDLLTVGVPAPYGRRRLLLRHAAYHRTLVRALDDLVQAGDSPRVIVAGHLLHLPIARRFPQALWLYDAAEYYAEDLSAYFGPLAPLARPLVRLWERRLLGTVSGILSVDSAGGWFERRLAASGRPVLVVPNYPSRADDPPEPSRPAPHGAGVLAYAGGLQEDKGLFVMLEAVAHLHRRGRAVRLLLVGPQRGSPERLDARIRALGLSSAVEVHPPLPYAELVALLATRADVALALHQPSLLARGLGGGNGRKLFTYMQAGLALLVPDEGEVARPALEAEAALAVRTDDPAAVAAAAASLLDHPDDLARRKRLARSAFLERHNWEVFAPVLDGWLGERLKAVPAPSTPGVERRVEEPTRG